MELIDVFDLHEPVDLTLEEAIFRFGEDALTVTRFGCRQFIEISTPEGTLTPVYDGWLKLKGYRRVTDD